MDSLTSLIISVLVIGQLSLAVPIFARKSIDHAFYLPLTVFLLSIGFISLEPVINNYFFTNYYVYIAISFPVLFLLNPTLRFYLEGITATKKWKPELAHGRHLLLVLLGVIVTAQILILTPEQQREIFISESEGYQYTSMMTFTVISMFLAICCWLIQSVMTFYWLSRRIYKFRKQFKQLFSDQSSNKTNVINRILVVVAVLWLLIFFGTFLSELMPLSTSVAEPLKALLILLLVWSMCYFGLSQKAVIVQYYESLPLQEANKSNEQEVSQTTTTSKVSPSVENKYQRSALDSEQSNRIASKIEMALKTEQLYLDSQLTLHKLANHLAISANYISQTLNETLSTNFFDYVNKWRIEAAKELVIENNKTIEEIADSVGFNARSSFYKAFKLYTGITPGAYRKQAANKGANS